MDLSALNVENVETPKSDMDKAKEFFDKVITEIGNRYPPFAKRINRGGGFTEEECTAVRNYWYRLRYPEMGYAISFQDDGIYIYRKPLSVEQYQPQSTRQIPLDLIHNQTCLYKIGRDTGTARIHLVADCECV